MFKRHSVGDTCLGNVNLGNIKNISIFLRYRKMQYVLCIVSLNSKKKKKKQYVIIVLLAKATRILPIFLGNPRYNCTLRLCTYIKLYTSIDVCASVQLSIFQSLSQYNVQY